MSATSDFYLARAAESALLADATDLANVRDRWLRAESAWRAMAEKLVRSESKRAEAAIEKAERSGL
ncbi:hypothetical protein GG804_15835 [Sphingomonas histidinilytica]|jgi:hypothetical protein|uniref:Uncharacterized protein n=1 Tax=Rhizorhabdus histidinilytica TaxID=439228 RepID=A0A1T4ZQW9_9SPHN|nr:hypothetical protein [Rhizorhabdus histidinilytica]MBO9378240.1 hypothetical protein [Rhizorhabdus histidinilytica]QEH78817.1 hypothetical protein EIK56_11905 [Sphingomonas sp. C8-2]SKB24949.1 hypothetical protein SAMN06295920_10130 [Rhizorhabdus histidinilytica]